MEWSDRIGRRIRLRDLHIVLAVAEAGSMAKAAQRLAISHPVVSKTISDLEQTLKVTLFDRTAQGVEVTNYGQALLKCGVNVFDEMRQGLKQIEFLNDPASGELAVGCPEIMNAGIVPAISERFLQHHPRVQLRVVHADIALAQYGPLRERKVELLIGRPPEPFIEEGLISEPLIQEPFVAIAGIDSPWARRRLLQLADLIEEPWVLPPSDSTPGTIVAGIFKAEGLQPAASKRRHIVSSTNDHPDWDRQIRWTPAELGGALWGPSRRTENPPCEDTGYALFDCDHHR